MDAWYSFSWFSSSVWQQYRFANPLALYGIPAILLLFGLRHLLHRSARQRLRLSFSGPTEIRQGELARLIISLRYLLPVSVFLALAFLLVALARPQIVREQRENESEGIDIMLALDVSSSMNEQDLKPSRLVAARHVAQIFVAGRQNDRIGLVIFAGEALSLCPLTTDYELIGRYLTDITDKMITTSGTAIGDALARCINRMRESSGKSKVVILLSDGDNTAGNLDPLTAARLAEAFGIRLYTIAVGKPSSGELDETVLKEIARTGHGIFFRATDAQRLQQVFGEINQLEKGPVRTRIYEDVQDYYRPYLYWSIAFMLVVLFLKNTIFGNILED